MDMLPELNDELNGLLFSGRNTDQEELLQNDASSQDSAIVIDDVTVVFGARVHEGNLWLLDRLDVFADYYSPLPKLVVVDFGSEPEFAARLEEICAARGYKYVFVEDRGVYSASIARNIGFQNANTDFVFQSDPDFFFARDFFARLVRLANTVRMRKFVDVMLMCPVYHLTELATRDTVALRDLDAISERLEYLAYHGTYENFGRSFEFVAPYSNCFLANRKFLSIIGGYNADFRGHGSEDFEFFVRATRYTKSFPMPIEVSEDVAGPLKKEFFGPKNYRGFRVLSNLVGLPSEVSGLKGFHLFHPRRSDESWKTNHDWKRGKLKNVLSAYGSNPHNLLALDYLKRDKKVICICIHKDHWGYFVPLRGRGYELLPVYDATVEAIEKATNMIVGGEVDALAIMNPYMTSHSKFKGLFLLAQQNIKTIVIERGALPGTVYYASDVAYTDGSYSEERFQSFLPEGSEVNETQSYIELLKKGNLTLEANASYEFTSRKYGALLALKKQICFVPLQLDEDMAVTKFVREAQKYADFANSIDDVARSNSDMVFVVKPHPLVKSKRSFNAENIILADPEDNIHALIDMSSCTVCYNSGVGLLSIIHGCPTYTVGNAYYNRGKTGVFCDSFEDAVGRFKSGPSRPDHDEVLKLVTWLRKYRYSFFSATDDVREFAERKAHGYKDVMITRLVLDGVADDLGRAAVAHPFSERSYGMGHLGLSLRPPAATIGKPASPTSASKPAGSQPNPGASGQAVAKAPVRVEAAVSQPHGPKLPYDLRPELILAAWTGRRGDGCIEIASGKAGHGVYGPYLPVKPGTYQIVLEVSREDSKRRLFSRPGEVAIDVAVNGGREILASCRVNKSEMKGTRTKLTLDVSVPPVAPLVPLELRVWSDGKDRIVVSEALLTAGGR
ncbi:capsular polysaccharide export protein, LipB/KpsS family [Roseicella aquatilis]|nr:glycosyltransferase [Roseicella aquatilis]